MRHADRLAVALLAILLTWLAIQGFGKADGRIRIALSALDRYAAAESSLHRDVFGARARLLNNYDPLSDHLAEMADAERQVRQSMGEAGPSPAADDLLRNLRQQEMLGNRFKTENALLQNSLAYFSMDSAPTAAQADPVLRSGIDRLSSAILDLSVGTSPTARNEVGAAIAAIDARCGAQACDRGVRRLLSHGRLLQDQLPRIGATMTQLVRADGKATISRLRQSFEAEAKEARDAAGRYRILSYFVSLLLLLLLVRWGLQVRAHATALRRQLKLEHAVSLLSTRLIAARPSQIVDIVRHALGDLGRALGAAQAIFHSSRGDVFCAWPDRGGPDPRWKEALSWLAISAPGRQSDLCFVTRADVPNGSAIAAVMDASGLESCYCLLPPPACPTRDTLVFGLLRHRAGWSNEQLRVLRTAMDAISLATARGESDADRARLQAQLDQGRRMETVGAFASGIAHNFNNLLGAIGGHVEMASATLRKESRARLHIDQIARSAERGTQLVQSLLSYGRRREKGQETINLVPLVVESTGLAEAALGPTYRIGLSLPEACPMVMAHAAQLQQVILNLCRNAAQAMPEGGSIDVEVRIVGADAEVAVSDHGHGIAADVMAYIFDPFFTTRPTGTGLGLSTARDIVVEQGGELTLESDQAGAIARLRLPLSDGIDPSTASIRKGDGETILYLAIDTADRIAGEDLLAALGYEPAGYTDVSRATAAFIEAPERFSAVLGSDLALGDLADSLFALTRKEQPLLPRMLAVHQTGALRASELAEAGVTAVLRYPLIADELAIALADALHKKAAPARIADAAGGKDA